MAEPTAPGTTSVVPVVAFCGVAIVALVVLAENGRADPRRPRPTAGTPAPPA